MIEVVIEYEADEENGDELLDLSEDAELAGRHRQRSLDLLATENDAELEAARNGTRSRLQQTVSVTD